jgi:hypothetical protein
MGRLDGEGWSAMMVSRLIGQSAGFKVRNAADRPFTESRSRALICRGEGVWRANAVRQVLDRAGAMERTY